MLERCRGWLTPALEDASWAEVAGELAARRAQLWPGERAAMVTTLQITPQGPTCHVWLGGGELSELLEMAPGIEAWARAQGCAFVTLSGRKGWARALKRRGFAPWGEELRKRL